MAAAAPADCGKCQRKALTMPKSWRHQHAKERRDELVAPNTVLKQRRIRPRPARRRGPGRPRGRRSTRPTAVPGGDRKDMLCLSINNDAKDRII